MSPTVHIDRSLPMADAIGNAYASRIELHEWSIDAPTPLHNQYIYPVTLRFRCIDDTAVRIDAQRWYVQKSKLIYSRLQPENPPSASETLVVPKTTLFIILHSLCFVLWLLVVVAQAVPAQIRHAQCLVHWFETCSLLPAGVVSVPRK